MRLKLPFIKKLHVCYKELLYNTEYLMGECDFVLSKKVIYFYTFQKVCDHSENLKSTYEYIHRVIQKQRADFKVLILGTAYHMPYLTRNRLVNFKIQKPVTYFK